ncbi:MAG: DUF5615 family PIN-like protein [Fulvivirga sp.]
MKYLANENVPFSSITYLKSKGYDVKAIGVDDPGITDEQVMQIAIDENRTIITYDSDYGELINFQTWIQAASWCHFHQSSANRTIRDCKDFRRAPF